MIYYFMSITLGMKVDFKFKYFLWSIYFAKCLTYREILSYKAATDSVF